MARITRRLTKKGRKARATRQENEIKKLTTGLGLESNYAKALQESLSTGKNKLTTKAGVERSKKTVLELKVLFEDVTVNELTRGQKKLLFGKRGVPKYISKAKTQEEAKNKLIERTISSFARRQEFELFKEQKVEEIKTDAGKEKAKQQILRRLQSDYQQYEENRELIIEHNKLQKEIQEEEGTTIRSEWSSEARRKYNKNEKVRKLQLIYEKYKSKAQ